MIFLYNDCLVDHKLNQWQLRCTKILEILWLGPNLTLSALTAEIATKSWGGAKRPHLEINEGVLWYPMLLKIILKPIKVMITCKILGLYLKNLTRYWDLKIERDIEIWYRAHLLDLVLILCDCKIMFSKKKISFHLIFLVPPSKRGRGRKLKFKFHQNFHFLGLR